MRSGLAPLTLLRHINHWQGFGSAFPKSAQSKSAHDESRE
jgi:hypothetical protein